jgi:glycosyltransferase involved in cell wall biosynthesis
LLSAYALLPNALRSTTLLVLAGKDFLQDRQLHELISKFGLEGRVLLPGFVSDEDLPVLLRSCVSFVFPSTHEGFGLPVLEAMACGVPVLGGTGSAVEEIIGDKRALFDPFCVQSMSDRIAQVLRDEHLRAELARHGLARAKFFSWEKAARTLWFKLEEELEKQPRSRTSILVTEQAVINSIAKLKPFQQKDGLQLVASSLSESFPQQRSPAIFLDISRVILDDHRTGIQRVTRAILKELAGNSFMGRDIRPVFGSPGIYGFREANNYMRDMLDLDCPETDEVVDFAAGDVLLFLDLHPSLAINQQEYTKYLRRKGVKVMHVVYDLIPVLRPELFWLELCAEFQDWLRVVCSSDGAVCISSNVANDFTEYVLSEGIVLPHSFGISWFHLGADLESSLPTHGLPDRSQDLLDQLRLSPSFLMVGTLEPRKGHRQVLEAFELLWKAGNDINLVIVGKKGWNMESFVEYLRDHAEYGRRLVYLQNISDEFLGQIYDVASCLVAASECEGFGLPLIEAAQHKLPIVARDIPVFREVAGEYAYYFKADHSVELAHAIKSWLVLYKNGKYPKSANMPWLTWKESAAQLMKALQLSVPNITNQKDI